MLDFFDIKVSEHVRLKVTPSSNNAVLYQIEKGEAFDNAEAEYQLLEGCEYEYEFVDEKGEGAGCQFLQEDEIVRYSKQHKSGGKIRTGIYVGTLELKVKDKDNEILPEPIQFEVRSSKADYRTDYRKMMEDITHDYVDLVMQQGSPVSQNFEIDPDAEPETLYQQFAFVRSVVNSDEFDIAIHKIIANPVRKWTETIVERPIYNAKRMGRSELRQIASAKDRIPFEHPENYGLPTELSSLPRNIKVRYHEDTIDTPENRFIKHVITTFYSFCSAFNDMKKATTRLKQEAQAVCNRLSEYRNNLFFKQISDATHINFNSPVLQRKEGYREVLQAWLIFDMAAKLTWKGGEDLYKAGKKNVATLYEYWLYFRLIEIVKHVFQIAPQSISELVKKDTDGINLDLKQGRTKMVSGIYNAGSRKLNVSLYYNRSFSHHTDSLYIAGTWTAPMRPDYTLSIWPGDINEDEAEKEEIIVHIHFDAKYRMEKFITEIDDNGEDGSEKEQEEKGIYKRADLLKMHAYKDAIRRTSGAYVLYPGTENIEPYRGFHEVIPGLGAFCLRPSCSEKDSYHIIRFLTQVTDNLLDRISQRERVAYHQHVIYEKQKEDDTMVCEPMPEYGSFTQAIIPDETLVAIGYAKDDQHIAWIEKEKLYNFRTGTGLGSVPLSVINAKYLLIHKGGQSIKLYKIVGDGPVLYSKADLAKRGYPSPQHDIYVVFRLEDAEKEFQNYHWKMKNFDIAAGNTSAIPKTTTLTELMLKRER